MALIIKSLDAVSGTGPGDAMIFDVPKNTVSIQVTCTADTAFSAFVEGTIDGVTWWKITDNVNGNQFSKFAVPPVISMRANLLNLPSAGTVTVWLAAV